MDEPSPSERELATGTLVLFPDGEKDEQKPVAPSAAATHVELQVQVLLRDVRDPSQPLESRRAWLDRAWRFAEPLSRFGWFPLHLALVRHAKLVGDDARGRARALELVDHMRERPAVEITNQQSSLKNALNRAVKALRVAILARTIKLDIGDVLPTVVAIARSDRSTDDRTRVDVLLSLLAGTLALEAGSGEVGDMLVEALGAKEIDRYQLQRCCFSVYMLALAAKHAALEARICELWWEGVAPYRDNDDAAQLKRSIAKARREHGVWFKRETAKHYVAAPIYEWDYVPRDLYYARVNAGRA